MIATRHTPPFAFFFLNVCVGWPVGVVGLALSNALVRSGLTVGQTASIVASASLPFTLQFLWGPIVDSSATRRRWFLGGTLLMCVCLAALLSAPWKAASVHLLAMLAFLSCLGAALSAAATKGLIAHHVRTEQLASASGWYISGGGFSHAVAGAGTLWLLTYVTSPAFGGGDQCRRRGARRGGHYLGFSGKVCAVARVPGQAGRGAERDLELNLHAERSTSCVAVCGSIRIGRSRGLARRDCPGVVRRS